MTTLDRGEEKLKFEDLQQHYDQDDISGYCSLNSEKAESPVTPNISRTSTAAAVPCVVSTAGNTPPSLDEKRMRREIANSNERRRMQSINAGFQSLRTLLPHHEGEKLSKAAILQQTAEYVYQLEQERTQLLSQNCQLKRIISQHEGELALNNSPPSPTVSKKRKTTDSSDDDVSGNDEFMELKMQLDRERALRIHLEEKVQRLESLYPMTTVTTTEKIQDSMTADQITIQYKEESKDENMLLSTGNSFENRREVQCSGVVTQNVTEPKRNVSTSVILQPVTHEESLLPSAIMNGHQYAVSPALAAQSTCSSTTSVKHKPKVEVERLPSPTSVALVTTVAATRLTNTTSNSSTLICNNTSSSTEQTVTPSSASATLYLASTSRQNLETIVEAIRHLEGDSLFESASGTSSGSSSSSSQEVPLALTKRTSTVLEVHTSQLNSLNPLNPFLRFHSRPHSQSGNVSAVNTNTEQQQRPGVIVVKQQT